MSKSLPTKVTFAMDYDRRNVNAKHGVDHALKIRFYGHDNYWVVHEWQKRPNAAQIQMVKDIFIRSCECYHRAIRIPSFGLEATEEMDIVIVRCKCCGGKFDQERNGHFAELVKYVEYSSCPLCSPNSHRHQCIHFTTVPENITIEIGND